MTRHPDSGPCIFHLRGTSLSASLDYVELPHKVSMIVQVRPTAGVTYYRSKGSVTVDGVLDKFRSLGNGEYEVVLDLGGVQPGVAPLRSMEGDDGPQAA
jgi:hypothetical protein